VVELFQILIGLGSVIISSFLIGLGIGYFARRKLIRKEITWQEYRKRLRGARTMVPIGVIFMLVGYYGFETEPILEIPFTNLIVKPALLMVIFIVLFALGMVMLPLSLGVLLYSMKKPSADKE
jgi:hypothetical protein